MQNPFQTLGIPETYAFDRSDAEKKHRELSKAVHPDRYQSSGASERQAAMHMALEFNEAWRTVRDPITRAEALYQLRGVAVGDGQEPKPTPAFLMEMMELREELEALKESSDADARTNGLARLESNAREQMGALEVKLTRLFSETHTTDEIKGHLGLLGELRYATRILSEIERTREDSEE